MTARIGARFALDYGPFKLDVDLRLPGSGTTVLFGPSGSGKTTLLRCIAGLERPPLGCLRINGTVWQDSDRGFFLPAHCRELGYVFQDANLFPHLTVAANLQFGIRRAKRPASAAELGHILDLLGISHLLQRLPDKLSGGERQRVAIARALALRPKVLLMDEPLASLDTKRKQEILPFLSQLQRELDIPVLYVTHSQQEAAQLADTLLILDKGRVQALGPLPDTLSRLDIPLAHDRDAASVWPATVAAHDAAYRITRIDFAGGSLELPLLDAETGTPLRVQIYARDVSLALEKPHATSILNILPATVTGIANQVHDGQTAVRLLVGDQPLLAHISRKSAELLGVRLGMDVFVQIKATSMLN